MGSRAKPSDWRSERPGTALQRIMGNTPTATSKAQRNVRVLQNQNQIQKVNQNPLEKGQSSHVEKGGGAKQVREE